MNGKGGTCEGASFSYAHTLYKRLPKKMTYIIGDMIKTIGVNMFTITPTYILYYRLYYTITPQNLFLILGTIYQRCHYYRAGRFVHDN